MRVSISIYSAINCLMNIAIERDIPYAITAPISKSFTSPNVDISGPLDNANIQINNIKTAGVKINASL